MPSNFKALAGAAGGGDLADPNFKNVTLLLHGDGSNGAQNNTFLDSSTNNFTITRNGNTTQGSFSPYGSNWSNYFDGTGDYLSIADNAALDFGSGDFTIELWAYYVAVGGAGGRGTISKGTTTGGSFLIFQGASNELGFYASSNGSTWDITAGAQFSSNIPLNTWHHIAVSRSGTTFRLFLNGALVTSFTSSAALVDNASSVDIGTFGSAAVNGYISNVRLVKGTALYTAAFTPSTTPLTAITNTSLLTCQSNRFRDASTNNFTITRNGDVKVTNFAPFAPSSAYSTTTNGGSAYFDGAGDSIDAPNSAAFDLGSGDFTLEFWVNTTWTADSWLTGYYVSNPGYIYQIGYSVIIFSGTYYLYLISGSTETTVTIGSVSAISDGAWHHIACTRSGNTVRVFVDGQLAATSTYTSTLNNPTGAVYRIGGISGLFEDAFGGYISNLRLVKGTAVYTASFTPPSSPVTAITNTSLLTNFTNAAIFDNSMKNDLETVGNAQISTSVKKFGTGSMAFDGTGDALTVPTSSIFSFGTGDFTVECWLYFTSYGSGNQNVIDFRGSAGSGNNIALYLENLGGTGTKQLRAYNGTADAAATSNNFPLNTWTHVAITRASNNLRFFVGGSQVGSTTTVSTNYVNTAGLYVGAFSGNVANFYGYLDDLRITNGIARYTANFTPPTAAFANK